MNNSKLYNFAPLEDPTTQIRLLRNTRLLRGTSYRDGSLLSYDLAIYNLSGAPEYDAISYTWGDAGQRRIININGFPISVTSNCYHSLLQARIHGSICTWIDSICINQQNLQEKGHQVARMWDFYRAATRVLVWFGHLDEASDRVYAACLDIESITANADDDAARDKRVTIAFDEGRLLQGSNTTLSYLSEDRDLDQWTSIALLAWLNDHDSEYCKALCEDYNRQSERPYFERLWILQELHAGQSRVRFMFRDGLTTRLILHYMKRVLDVAVRESHGFIKKTIIEPVVRASNQISSSCDLVPENGGLDFKYLDLIRDRKCHDDRDRFYGTLHLLDWKAAGIAPLQPDYTKTAFEVAASVGLLSKSFRLTLSNFVRIVGALKLTMNDPALLPLWSHRDADTKVSEDEGLTWDVTMIYVCRLSGFYEYKYPETNDKNCSPSLRKHCRRMLEDGDIRMAYGPARSSLFPRASSMAVPNLARAGDYIIKLGSPEDCEFALVMRLDPTCTAASIIGRAGRIRKANIPYEEMEWLDGPSWSLAHLQIETSAGEAISLVAPNPGDELGIEQVAFEAPKVIKIPSLDGFPTSMWTDGFKDVAIVDWEQMASYCSQLAPNALQGDKSERRV